MTRKKLPKEDPKQSKINAFYQTTLKNAPSVSASLPPLPRPQPTVTAGTNVRANPAEGQAAAGVVDRPEEGPGRGQPATAQQQLGQQEQQQQQHQARSQGLAITSTLQRAVQRTLQFGQAAQPAISSASKPLPHQPRNTGPTTSTARNQQRADAPPPVAVLPITPTPFRVKVVQQSRDATMADGGGGGAAGSSAFNASGATQIRARYCLEVEGLAHQGDAQAAHNRYQRVMGSLPPPAVDTCGGPSGARAAPELAAYAGAAGGTASGSAAAATHGAAATAGTRPWQPPGSRPEPANAAPSFCGRAPPPPVSGQRHGDDSVAAGAAGAGPSVEAAVRELPAVMRMGLNDEQLRAAISESDRPLLIVAGAGTGKTSTLISRVVHLIQDEHIDPRDILIITFTNKAAAEVRERLQRCGVNPRGLIAATFHSFCFSVLRFYYKFAGFAQCPTVWTDTDLKRAIALALRLDSLEFGRADMTSWVGLPAGAPWPDILRAVQDKHPDIWDSCNEAAKVLEEKQQKRKRKKTQEPEPDGGTTNGRGGKKGAKKQRTASKGPATSKSTAAPAPSAANAPSHAAASDAGPADTAATADTGDRHAGGDVAGGNGNGAGNGAGSADGLGAAANSRLLFRAELLKLMYEKLQAKYAPGTESVVGAKPKPATVNGLLHWVDHFKRTGGNIADYQPRARFYMFFQAILRGANAIDFNDMLLLVDRLITENRWILDRLQRRHRYVLVDEYQDCSLQQVRFVELLSGGSGRLTAVGDDAQSIYRFRGAMPNVFGAFRDFHRRQLQQTVLEQNYRSRPKILTVGQHVLEGSASVTRKVLRPTKDDTADQVTFIEAGTPMDEAEAIGDQVEQLVKEGMSAGDVAVLFRCFKLGGAKTHMPLQAALRNRGIPFVLVRDKSVFERKEVQDTLAYLRLAINPADDTAFLRVYNTPPRRLGDVKAAFMGMLQDLQESLDRQRRELDGIAARRHQMAPPAGRRNPQEAPPPQRRPGELAEDDPAAHPPTSQRPPEHSLYGLCCALLQEASGDGSGGVDLMEYRLSSAHRTGVEKLVQVVENLRRSVWQLGPAGAIKRALELTGYVEWLAEKKASKEREAQDAAQELAMSPGGAARAAREKAARAVDAQDSEAESEDEEEEEGAAGAPAQAGDATAGAGHDEDDEDEETEEEEDELPPLPAGLPPEPQELGDAAKRMLGLKLLFKEAKLFAAKWQVPSKAFALPPSAAGEAGGGRGVGAPELFTLAAHAVMSSFSGEQVQAALQQAHPVTRLPRVTPEVLEQMYAEQRRGPLVMRDFLAHVALSDREVEAGGADAAAAKGGARGRQSVNISTIHAAKGLEFPVVFVARWAEGYLPTVARPDKQELERMSPQEQAAFVEKDAQEHAEEERRLAHVAVTRAMERLYITSIRVHRVQGKTWLVAPSSIALPDDSQVVEVRRLPPSPEETAWTQAAEDNGRN